MPSAVEADKRRRELAAIHIGAEALGLDDETYRDMLAHVAGKRSAGKLDAAGRRAKCPTAPTTARRRGRRGRTARRPR